MCASIFAAMHAVRTVLFCSTDSTEEPYKLTYHAIKVRCGCAVWGWTRRAAFRVAGAFGRRAPAGPIVMGAAGRLAKISSGLCTRGALSPASASDVTDDHGDTATPTDSDRVTLVSVYGSTLDQESAGRCQEILQRSFYPDPERRGYYIPLPEHLLLAGEAKEQAVGGLLGQASLRRERWHLAYDTSDGALAALATTFEHTVRLADGVRRKIWALGEVATHPDYRGRGHGAAAVRAAFGEVSGDGSKVMLWQTGEAQGLYEKLGARVRTIQ